MPSSLNSSPSIAAHRVMRIPMITPAWRTAVTCGLKSLSAGLATTTARRRTGTTTTTTTTAANSSSNNGDRPTTSSTPNSNAAAVAQGYWTLASPMLDVELVVKKSRFIASAWPVSSAAEAQRLISAASDPSASHNCWAWRVGGASRSTDDGEPGGTAGRPILSALECDGLDGVLVLVVRFFGGAELGKGPLARAYAQSARDAVRAAPKAFVRAMVVVCVVAPQQDVGAVYGVLARFDVEAGGGVDFLEEEEEEDGGKGGGGRMALEVSVAADRARALGAAMAEATAGRATTTEVLDD